MRLRLDRSWMFLGAAWLLTSHAGPCLGGPEPNVTIAGGADFSGHQYVWRVTNLYRSPVVFVAFPEHHADVFVPPEHWESACEAGVCSASADQGVGIRSGETAVFRLRVGPKGAKRGIARVDVRFADGVGMTVADVEVPRAESRVDQYAGLIGLALAFGAAVAIHRLKARRRRHA